MGQYKAPDPTFDAERWLLEALVCMQLAEDAITQRKPAYARILLERASVAGSRSQYYTPDNERRRLLLLHNAGGTVSEKELPDLSPELLLRAEAALRQADWARCAVYLAAVADKNLHWHYLTGQMYFAQNDFTAARPHFEAAWDLAPKECCARLEDCCREAADFTGAYFYACKLRELNA